MPRPTQQDRILDALLHKDYAIDALVILCNSNKHTTRANISLLQYKNARIIRVKGKYHLINKNEIRQKRTLAAPG